MDEIQDWLHMAANGTRAGTLPPPGGDIAAWLNGVNAGLTQATGGWGELRTLVPLTLAFLGLRSLRKQHEEASCYLAKNSQPA